jgi:Cu(I)/Ag(I) efflux system membrane fusion protein
MYVTKGQTIFNLLNPHMVLAELKINTSDISKIKLNQRVQLKFEGMAHTMNGTIDFIEPTFQNNSKTLIARVYLENENHEFKVGMYLKAIIDVDSVEGLWIPKQSMLDLGKRKIVWMKSKNKFTAHEIKTGIEGPEVIQVLEGITDSDAMASNAQYIQDSESFITAK